MKFFLGCRVGSIFFVVGLIACSSDSNKNNADEPIEDTFTGAKARTFTNANDFQQGEFVGVNSDNPGQLQLSSGLGTFETPYIWLPNSDDRTLDRIDTSTLEKAGPFELDANVLGRNITEDCYSPSRTTVDIEGNVWVGCRGENSYINTEQVGPPDYPVPNIVDYKVVKVAKDGSVLLSVPVGYAPRGMALDAQNNLWVGCSVDDSIWKLNGDTGACLIGDRADCAQTPAIRATGMDFPYGAVVDQRQHLWVVSRNFNAPHRLTEIDTLTGTVIKVHGPYLRNGASAACHDLYGIAIDQHNDVWVGGYLCDDILKIKGVAGTYYGDNQTYTAGQLIGAYYSGKRTRGVAVDLDGNVWGAISGNQVGSVYDAAVKLSGSTGEVIDTVTVADEPTGVGVDALGNAWVVSMRTTEGPGAVHWINGLQTSQKQEIKIGNGPYTYSDMLGMALRTITHQADGFAKWNVKVDSGNENTQWLEVRWQGFVPTGTTIRVRGRCAPSETALATAAFGDYLDQPGTFSCGSTNNRWAEFEVRFSKESTGGSPVLYDFTAVWN